MSVFKIRWLVYLILAYLIFVIAGALAPFIQVKTVTDENAGGNVIERVYGETGSTDRAMLLESSTDARRERLRLLYLAQQRIVLSTFDIEACESTSDLFAVLYDRAKAGVSISILADGFHGGRNIRGAYFQALSALPNVEIRLYNPINPIKPWTTQGRLHDKYIIVDDIGYILGGRNTTERFLGTPTDGSASLDRDVLIYNTVHGQTAEAGSLPELYAYFLEIWDSGNCSSFGEEPSLLAQADVQAAQQQLEDRFIRLQQAEADLFAPFDYTASTHPTDSITLLRGETGIYSKTPLVLHQLGQLMQQAKERVWINTPYAVCDAYMDEILSRTADAVPEVLLMLNSVENGANLMASADYLYHKDELIETGVRILEYDGGTSYHGKSMVIDQDVSIIGSFNLDMRSTYVDTELMLVIRSKSLTTELTGYMQTLQTDCRTVLTETTYSTPAHLEITPLPAWKDLLLRALGAVGQCFRVLI